MLLLMSTTTYVFVEIYEKYQYFYVEKSASITKHAYIQIYRKFHLHKLKIFR